MATIIEGAKWNLSEAAAQRMVENGLIRVCECEHIDDHAEDHPIYHRDGNAPNWFGFATMSQAITSAEAHVKAEVDAEAS